MPVPEDEILTAVQKNLANKFSVLEEKSDMQLARLFLIPTFLDYLIHLKLIAYDMLLLCPFSQWRMVPEQQKSVQCEWRICGWWLVNLLLTTFPKLPRDFSFANIFRIIYP